MNRGIRIISTIAFCLVLGWSTVWAQEQDDFLQRYELALENLTASVQALPENGSVAREELDRAVNALRTLARTSEGAPLVAAMERIFERAREAIANQSATDLAVQIEVLRGGFQRLVYDSALRSAIEGDLETARTRLVVIAADVGVGDAAMTALADPERSIAELRYAFEVGVAASVRQSLERAREQTATNLDDAYRSLADAYGDYLLVQDSPRMPDDVNSSFVSAANALVDTQIEPLLAGLSNLEERFATLEQSAASALVQAPTPTEPTTPSELPATQAPDATEGEPDIEEPGVAQPDVAQADVAPSPDAETIEGEPADDAEAVAPTPEELAAEIVAQIAAEEREQQLSVLVAELAVAGVAEQRRSELAERILDGGYVSLEGVIRDLYADAAEAADAIERGQPEVARGFVRIYSERYRQLIAPIVTTTAPPSDLRTTALTSQLATVEGIRLQDVVVLSSQAGVLRDILAGGEPTAAHRAAADTVRFWAGLVRTITVIVLGLLAFVPLYLLNLAFGGGNRNWRLVGVALFLLLVPVIYEAVAFIADLLAGVTGIDSLHAVAQYSMFHNPMSYVVWAAVTGLAILFAIGGLYGICVQFGLLGRRSVKKTSDTQIRDTVEWDEEF